LPPASGEAGGGWGNSDAASCKISSFSKCFYRSTQEFKTYSFKQDAKNLKTISTYIESNDFIFMTFQKINHLVTLSL
jgi:hypothetical protein